jgi:hypothetical protein
MPNSFFNFPLEIRYNLFYSGMRSLPRRTARKHAYEY